MRVRGSLLCLLGILGCVSPGTGPGDPFHYRLSESGADWDIAGTDPVLEDLLPRYPEFFEVVLDPTRSDEPDLLQLRNDLERHPADRRNYDALNAVAIAYFEMNARGEASRRAGGMEFLTAGFRAAMLVAVPWRAYGEIQDPALREAVLDFFADIASGEKRESRRTRGRLTRVVGSLERKESDPGRLARIRGIRQVLKQAEAEAARMDASD